MSDDLQRAFGLRPQQRAVNHLMHEMGMNCSQLAEWSGYAEQTVRNWVNGTSSAPFDAIVGMYHASGKGFNL